MKTIQIDREDEAALVVALRQAGFSKYAERIESSMSFLDPSFSSALCRDFSATVPCERSDGTLGTFGPKCLVTGFIEDFATIKEKNISYFEVATVGYFRAPDGHLCEAGCYPKYFKS